MNLLDVNLLLYAYDEMAPLHAKAKSWLENEFTAPTPTGLTMSVIVAFLRIATNARILAQPMGVVQACSIVEQWLSLPTVHVMDPTEKHWSILKACATAADATGLLVPDADLAASAMEHGATLCTHDRDFTRFDGLRVSYPLMSA
jgi:toxin-antitoxin system PIN domain toxin